MQQDEIDELATLALLHLSLLAIDTHEGRPEAIEASFERGGS
jgi:hypothetical protein